MAFLSEENGKCMHNGFIITALTWLMGREFGSHLVIKLLSLMIYSNLHAAFRAAC